MSEKLQQQIVLVTNNTIRILAFVALAMVFNKWWISLFSALFLVSYDKKGDDPSGKLE